MSRIINQQVQVLVGDSSLDASSFIETATIFVDANLLDQGLTTDQLAQIELYLAGHFAMVTATEGPLAAQTLGEGSERYHNIYAAGLKATRFGQQAILLDTSGVLANLAARAEAPNKYTAQFQVI